MKREDFSQEVQESINFVNEKDVYDFIKIPKDDLNERVEILGREFNKEQKRKILREIKEALKSFFDKHVNEFESMELPLPTSAEVFFSFEGDVLIEGIHLYDSCDRIIDWDEWRDIEVNNEHIEWKLFDCIYTSVEVDVLANYFNGKYITFGDVHNQ